MQASRLFIFLILLAVAGEALSASRVDCHAAMEGAAEAGFAVASGVAAGGEEDVPDPAMNGGVHCSSPCDFCLTGCALLAAQGAVFRHPASAPTINDLSILLSADAENPFRPPIIT